MNCLDAKLMLDDYIFGRTNPDDAALLEEHFATCPDCRDALEKERQLLNLMRAGEVPDPGAEYWEGVEKSILGRTISKGPTGPPDDGLSQSKGTASILSYLLPLAASILLLVFSISGPGFESQPPAPPDDSVNHFSHEIFSTETKLPVVVRQESRLLSSIIMSPPGSITRHLIISQLGTPD